jgi:ankyrin repeat protein
MNAFANQFRLRAISLRVILALLMLAWSAITFADDIHLAAARGDLEEVKRMLKLNPADLNSRNADGYPPLYSAISVRRGDVIQFLLDCGANLDIRSNDGKTALHWAADNNAMDTEILELILNSKAAVFIDAKDNQGNTPSHLAVANYNEHAMKLLLARKADVSITNKVGWTPLHIAAKLGEPGIVKLLLKAKIDVNAKDNEGRTPFFLAAANAHAWNDASFDNGTPVAQRMGLAEYDADKHWKVIQLLAAHKSDINAKDSSGRTPMHVAAASGKIEVVKWLLGHQANINARDNNGRTPLYMATAGGHRSVAELLLANKAANVTGNNNLTSMHTTTENKKRLPDGIADAAEQGYPEAQYSLAETYNVDDDVEQDYVQAAKWYHDAAQQGLVEAQYKLGQMYEVGHGVRKNFETAVMWYSKAAMQGNSSAQNSLGNFYQNGQGVQTDIKQAVELYKKAAAQGNANAKKSLEFVYANTPGKELLDGDLAKLMNGDTVIRLSQAGPISMFSRQIAVYGDGRVIVKYQDYLNDEPAVAPPIIRGENVKALLMLFRQINFFLLPEYVGMCAASDTPQKYASLTFGKITKTVVTEGCRDDRFEQGIGKFSDDVERIMTNDAK